IFLIAEGFGASRPGHGESAGAVAAGQARRQICTAKIFVQKAGIEAVAGADRVNCRYIQCRAGEALFSALRQRALMTEFYHYQGDHFSQLLDGLFRIVGPGDSRRLARIGQQHIDVFQQVFYASAPEVLRIIIGVERDGETGCFQAAKEFSYVRLQGLLEVERRQMKMTRIGKVVEVEIAQGEFGDGSRVRQDVAPARARQNDRDPGGGWTMGAAHFGNVHAALGQALKRNFPQRVVANQRLEPDLASQSRQVVGRDGGRTAQGKHHAVSQQFTLRRKLVRQAIKDEVEVQFSGDGDVKTWHV